MRGLIGDTVLFVIFVLLPGLTAWKFLPPRPVYTSHQVDRVALVLFMVSTALIFLGVRILLRNLLRSPQNGAASWLESNETNVNKPSGYKTREYVPTQKSGDMHIRSEIIHVQHSLGSARVVALLRVGEEARNVHLLELDIVGDDLRDEVIAEAVAGVAYGDFAEVESPPVERVGYAMGWGLTLPCPPQTH